MGTFSWRQTMHDMTLQRRGLKCSSLVPSPVTDLAICLTWRVSIIFMTPCCILCTSMCLRKKRGGGALACMQKKQSLGVCLAGVFVICTLYTEAGQSFVTEAGGEHPLEHTLQKKPKQAACSLCARQLSSQERDRACHAQSLINNAASAGPGWTNLFKGLG